MLAGLQCVSIMQRCLKAFTLKPFSDSNQCVLKTYQLKEKFQTVLNSAAGNLDATKDVEVLYLVCRKILRLV